MLSKVLWKSVLFAPALLGAALLNASVASAAESATEFSDLQLTDLSVATEVDVAELNQIVEAETAVEVAELPVAQAAPAASSTPSVASLDQISQYSAEGRSEALGQVTSVSQLTDVQPTDWAFQALQSLVERYGVIAGYPDGTYRGNRAMTRYEFAAGLNAALDRVNELIAAGLADAVTREDLAVLQRLQEEFAAELATLRGRVDALEARTAELEANQFSTTTRLNGEVLFNFAGAFDEGDVIEQGRRGVRGPNITPDSQITFGYRARLNFDTSFTGSDRLRTRFQARDVQNFESDPIGFSFGGSNAGNFELDDLVYTFPVGNRVQVTLGANSIDVDDFVSSTISPFDSGAFGSLSGFGFPQQYAGAPGNAGAGLILQLTDNVSLDLGYTAAEAANPSTGAGLFNGDYGAIAQLTFLSDFVDAALTYVNAYRGGPDTFTGVAEVSNTYGGQVNFKIGNAFEIGGGASYTPTRAIGTGDYRVWSYQGTLAFPDLGGEGNMLGILAGVPSRATAFGDGTFPLVGIRTEDASFVGEVFYRYRLNDNIAITPGIIWITDPFNNNANSDTVIGALRTTFSF